MKPRILFVEDDATFRGVMGREIEDFGYDVRGVGSGEEALEAMGEREYDLALVDLRLPGMDGIELLGRIKEQRPQLPVVLLTGHGTLPDAVAAVRAGAYDFLGKPVSLDQLELVLRRAEEHRRLVRRNQVLESFVDRGGAPEILGTSPAIEGLRRRIARFGASDANVLVMGESGTGKELVARTIHAASPRRDGALVVVNCGAIPAELFESELFGHDRGAFTGATRRRPGLIALADGGTLFLDELGELPLALQPALLRAIQFGEYRPVGSEETARSDFRLVAATNRDLAERVGEGEFREDLYHRVSTLTLEVPPLRERPEDVGLLARTLLERHGSDGAPFRLTDAAVDVLSRQPWPGNVRELENVIVRLVTLAEDPVIDAADVEARLGPQRLGAAAGLPTLDLASLEREAVLQALRRHGGNRRRAAAELGVATKTLYNKIKQHSIAPSEWGG